MQELESLLDKREHAMEIGFDNLDNRVRCYAHIINICSSHIVASMTPTSKSYLSALKVPVDPMHVTCDSDDGSSDDGLDVPAGTGADKSHSDTAYEPQLANGQRHSPGEWLSGIKRDPLRRARKLVNFFRSSDQRKAGLRLAITEGNERNEFIGKDNDDKFVVIKVPELELLKDVKTRWDSVYMMLERLRQLRPVRFSQV
jgi:hypothetical protein